MKTITCFCEHTFSIEAPEHIDLRMHPEIREKILTGTFMSFLCPQCGAELKPEFPVHITDGDKGIDLFFIPELERNSYLTGRTSYSAARIVIGFPELQEKFKLYEAQLDEKAIELIKAYFLERAESSGEIHIYFGKLEQEHLLFYIEGLKDSETAVTKISHQVYASFKEKIDNKTYDTALEEILTPPYISVEKIRVEGT